MEAATSADEDIDVTVAVEISRLDDPRQVGRSTEYLLGAFLEPLAGATIQENSVHFRVSRLGVVAAVGEQQINEAVAVEVGELDLVGPPGGLAEHVGGDVDPQVARRRGGEIRALWGWTLLFISADGTADAAE